MTSRPPEAEKIPSLQDIISSLETIAHIKPDIESYIKTLSEQLFNLTRDYYATLIFLFTTPLTFHQRLVLMYLTAIYPRGCSGVEITRALDISVQSKSIYRDLIALQKQEFIYLDEVHSRLKLAYANKDNQMVFRLIELFQIHGKLLIDSLQKK